MLLGFFGALEQELVEFAGFFAFLVEADDGFYGVAAVFEFALCYPVVNFFKGFFG